jgi:signal transduction histidine kinase
LSKLTQQPILYQGVAVPPLSDAIAITFYRFVQEALNNAVKHAEAGTVRVLLEYHLNHLSVTVADDGGGFDVPAANSTVGGGVGLISMRERLEMLGGEIEIHSTPGHGSRLVASYCIGKS